MRESVMFGDADEIEIVVFGKIEQALYRPIAVALQISCEGRRETKCNC